jgi:hypothetical protein
MKKKKKSMATKSEFIAAEEIKAILEGRDKTEQERILRWVGESIGTVTGQIIAPQPTVAASSAPQISPPLSAARRKDIKTFVGEKAPKNDVQFAAVTAYFYRFEASEAERKDVIVADDLQTAGRQARGYGFTKPLTTLNNAVTLGYFDRAGRGEFKLNAVGENLVAMTLPSSESTGKRSRTKKKRRGQIRKKGNKKRKTS